ncbi:FadR/GntR family transcriptional regulator [Enhygromyxa salina]|uniref:HTH-type transcriptional regulator Mce2R n=1 Tax=Enhygromyxa salina TaxID=215803 RepID=A0A2S9Y7R0_9BACT|nr:GntR family transcriptional regulator [Enhygromyxa salina]PRQ01139.1 HTH-type transcriptional regulator Mce2R [Enhygromyxa salina]
MTFGLEPVVRSSLCDAVFDQLAAQILARRIEPGQPLPSERDLCKALGVNRGALREALKRLVQAGLIEQRHGGGTVVLDYRRSGGLDLLTRLLFSPDGQPDLKVARAIMEMRAALAPDIARLCAQRATPDQITQLRAVVQSMREAAEPEDLERLQGLSLELWEQLVTGADNIAYRLAFNTLRHTYEQIRGALVIALANELRQVHACAQLVDAVAARDGARAHTCAGSIVERGSEGVLAAIDLFAQLQSGAPKA